MTELGLFPLNVVLLPGEQLPLHIFEPRYKELIGECLAEDTAFGVVLNDDAGLRRVGTLAKVTEVLERFDDGRLNVLVEGEERFRLLRVAEERSFQTGDVELIDDEDETPPAEEVAVRALELFRELRDEAGAETTEPEDEPNRLSFALAGRVDFGSSAKQELLELRSERERLSVVSTLLEHALLTVRLQRERRDLASRNGRPPRSDP